MSASLTIRPTLSAIVEVRSSTYTDLIPYPNRQPNFTEMVYQTTKVFDGVWYKTFILRESLYSTYDLSIATGIHLDAIGVWVGISRKVITSVSTHDYTAPITTSLSDAEYRTLLQLKIQHNSWDGNIAKLVATLNQLPSSLLGSYKYTINDMGNLSFSLGLLPYDSPKDSDPQNPAFVPSNEIIAFLTSNKFQVKPLGIALDFFFYPARNLNTGVSPVQGKYFGFDLDSGTNYNYYAGFDEGVFPHEIYEGDFYAN